MTHAQKSLMNRSRVFQGPLSNCKLVVGNGRGYRSDKFQVRRAGQYSIKNRESFISTTGNSVPYRLHVVNHAPCSNRPARMWRTNNFSARCDNYQVVSK